MKRSSSNLTTKESKPPASEHGPAPGAEGFRLDDAAGPFRAIVETTSDAILLAGPSGVIIFANQSAGNMFGYPVATLIGQPLTMLMPERYRDPHTRGIDRVRQSGVSPLSGQTLELAGLRSNGDEFPIELSLSSFNLEGEAGFGGIIRDLTSRKASEALLRAETSLVSVLHQVTAVANEGHSVSQVIQTALSLVCQYLGWPVGHCYRARPGDELIPTNLWCMEGPEDFAAFRQATEKLALSPVAYLPNRVMSTGRPHWIPDVTRDENFTRKIPGVDLRVRTAFAFPVFAGREPAAVLEFFSDEVKPVDARLMEQLPQIGIQIGRVIERERAGLALRESEDRYRDLVESSSDMICTHDFSGTILTANRTMARITGVERADDLIGRRIRDFISPDYRHEFDLYLERIRIQPQVEGFLKLQTPDGGSRIFEYSNTVRTDGPGVPIVRGVARDVTERYMAQRVLAGSERRYRLLFESSVAGIFRATVEGEVIDSNDSFARLLDYEDGKTLVENHALLAPVNDDWDRIAAEVVAAHVTTRVFEALEHLVSNFEICLVSREGRLVWLLAKLTYLPEEEGLPAAIEATCIDISERKIADQKVTFQAYHDALTELPNRFLFIERFSLALSKRNLAARPLALLYLDLDGFKPINDFFGHAVGDLVLKEVAARLSGQVRSADTIARIGGDEFVIILTGVHSEEIAAMVAQKFLDCILLPFRHQSLDLELTASIGIAFAPRDGTDQETLMRKADEAMYMAKTGGKNRFQFAKPDSVPAQP